MALTAADRKILSKKYVLIPEENAVAVQNIVQLDALIVEFADLDNSYKGLFESDNSIIELYHPEINKLLGQIRTDITETDIQNSAKKLLGNFFFPNQQNVPTPSLPDGVWKELKAYAKNKAVGKTYDEVYTTQDSEVVKITAVTALTSTIQSNYSITERQTGTPDTPPPPPFDLPTDLANLVTAVNEWELWLQDQETALLANTDSNQATQIANALADVQNALSEIASWKALPDYAIGGKVDDPGLDILNNEATARNTYIPIRISEIQARLGDVVQAANGSVTLSGLYGNRYVNIDSRINLADGTLTKKVGLELGKRVQTETIDNNNSYLSYLNNNVLKASKLTAPGNGTNIIQVSDGTLFSALDTVYVVSETQPEIFGTVISVVGNQVQLNFSVSSNFTLNDIARLVKEV